MLSRFATRALSPKSTRTVLALIVIVAAAVAQNFTRPSQPAASDPVVDPGIKDASRFDPKRPLGRELETNVPDAFILVTVGDCIISRPLLQYAARDEAFQKVLDILKRADVTYGNMETSIFDLRHFTGYPYPGPNDVSLVAAPEVARDLAQMGFDLVSRANNHALDWGVEGMRETSQWLETAGIGYAGAGENLGLAQAAGYFESPKGRIGLVSMASTFRPGSEALPAKDAAPSRPGINALNVKKSITVSAAQMAEVVRLRNALYPAEKDSKLPDELSLFDNRFVLGQSFGFQYEMDPTDLSGILRGVRQGKQHADFLIVSIHSHESAGSAEAEPKNDFQDAPADFVQDLARRAIDTGADTFVATGIHHLGPIEIYKGKPIFYGMGDFFWADIQEPMAASVYQQYRKALADALVHPEVATHADLNNVANALGFAGQPPFDAMIAESRFDHGRVAEIRLYPVDLGYGMKLTESGTPRLAGREQSQRILRRVQEISQKYGTKIQIDGSVGVIRP
jgi:poly-gamma-glutamate capsule biosynthesis protein CapA/YwtB (metallophosphatase superfamily)